MAVQRTPGFWKPKVLGRHADSLFWMARYLERAENSARRIQATLHHTLTRRTGGDEEWEAIIQSTGSTNTYNDQHKSFVMANVINFVLRGKTSDSVSYFLKRVKMQGQCETL